MSTVTLQIEDGKVEQLTKAAQERGLRLEELFLRLADDYLSRPPKASEADFKKSLVESVKENDELLRRLAK